MKITIINPITIISYQLQEENIVDAHTPCLYDPEYSFKVKDTDAGKTMSVEFRLIYYGGADCKLVFNYHSSTKFSFITEGYDTDLSSLSAFFTSYYKHTETFLSQFGIMTQGRIESIMRPAACTMKDIASSALQAIISGS